MCCCSCSPTPLLLLAERPAGEPPLPGRAPNQPATETEVVTMSKSLGQAAYDAYQGARAKTLPKAVVRPAPPWDQLTTSLRAAWETAATAVLEACGG
jgi:hypothetical protein